MSLAHSLSFIIFVTLQRLDLSQCFSMANNEHKSSHNIPLAYSTIGEAIQRASQEYEEDLLQIASQFWLPTDPDLPSHLKLQRIHHEKRQRWSAQLLEKLGMILLAKGEDSTHLQDDSRLHRAILASALPFDHLDLPKQDGRSIQQAICGLHTIVGSIFSNLHHQNDNSQAGIVFPSKIIDAILQLIDRANILAPKLSLDQVVEIRFAARGLLARIDIPSSTCNPTNLSSLTSRMDDRVARLPFDIVPCGIDWTIVLPPDDKIDPRETLQNDIPFRMDTFTTRNGNVVLERRRTAWVAESDIGALAYSGKLMKPQPIPNVICRVMRLVEKSLQLPPNYFDCALCNHYPDGDAACKFHTDPEHGTLWDRTTCVASIGACRKFAFRPIPGKNTWSYCDIYTDNAEQVIRSHEDTSPAAIHLFSGDIVHMWGECNDIFHHAVYPGVKAAQTTSEEDRISLVLKRAISRGSRKGHGLPGTGRRSSKKVEKLSPDQPSQAPLKKRT
jgi:alkylated DNA repair dioxygenase AlkB